MVATAETIEVPKRAFAYLRVSTRKQDPENQRFQISNYAKSHGLQIEEEGWFVDDATTGKIPAMERSGFREMMETIEESDPIERPERILVYEISRLGRRLWDILDVIRSIEKNSMLISTSPKETFLQIEDKPTRNLVLLIMAWNAERERDLTSQRTEEALALAKDKGRHSGNVPLGYSIHKCVVGKCFELPDRNCPEHGKLSFTHEGTLVFEALKFNPRLKPREIKDILPPFPPDEYSDYDRYAIIRNVLKFGDPKKKPGP